MKYTSSPYKLMKMEAQALLKKMEVFKKQTCTSKQVTIALVVSEGIQNTAYAKHVLSGIVTLKDLFH